MKIEKLTVLTFIFIFAVSFALFYPSLNYYFFQDDWFHFNISNAKNLDEFLDFFIFRQDIIGWRPIPKQVFFFLIQTIFKMNPLIAHLLIFAFFMGTILFIYFLTKLVLNDSRAGLIASFLYSTAAFHFISLSWVSAGENIIGTFFFVAAAYFFFSFFKNKKSVFYILSYLFFTMSLASTEFAITWPLFIFFIWFILNPKLKSDKFLKILKYITPTILLIIIYLIFRFVVFQLPAKADYQIVINFKVFNTLFWYILWFLNLPEVLKYHFLLTDFSLTKEFVGAFKFYLKPTILFFSLTLFALFVLTANNFRKNMSLAAITFFTFTTSLFPVLFLPLHTFPYYLSIPSVAVFIFFSYLIIKSLKKSGRYVLPAIIFLVSWYFISSLSLSFTKKTHWVTGEENISREVVTLAKSKYPTLPENSTIVLYPTDNTVKQSLMDQNAMRVIYNDPTLKTIYVSSVNEIESEQKNVYILKLDPIF